MQTTIFMTVSALLLGAAIFMKNHAQNKDFLENTNEILNDRPIIGIFTQPTNIAFKEFPNTHYSVIVSSYVKFVEESGARAVPIPYDADEKTLDTIFDGINGILVPGGSTLLSGPSRFTKAIAYMLMKALKANDDGDYFPIMGVCLGHEALHYILSGYDHDFRFRVYGEIQVLHPLQNVTRSAEFYKDMPDDLFLEITTNNVNYYHHSWAISPELYKKHKKLTEILEITAVNEDSKGNAFVASSQGIKYPILTTQYHSEKNSYEWEVKANHTATAVKITQHHSNVFVQMAKKNQHKFQDSVLEKNSLMYNYPQYHIEDENFTQVFILKNQKITTFSEEDFESE